MGLSGVEQEPTQPAALAVRVDREHAQVAAIVLLLYQHTPDHRPYIFIFVSCYALLDNKEGSRGLGVEPKQPLELVASYAWAAEQVSLGGPLALALGSVAVVGASGGEVACTGLRKLSAVGPVDDGLHPRDVPLLPQPHPVQLPCRVAHTVPWPIISGKTKRKYISFAILISLFFLDSLSVSANLQIFLCSCIYLEQRGPG
jgi:hypothetical protein